MPNYFIDSSGINDGRCLITGNDFYHLTRSRRASRGDALRLVDEKGRFFSAIIEDITPKGVFCSVEETASFSGAAFQLCLYAALLKGKKFDLALREGVETGVNRFVPVIAERCVPDYSEKAASKSARWRRIAEEAAKQSLSRRVALVEEIRDFSDVLGDEWDERVIAHIEGPDFRAYARAAAPRGAAVIVGPEGGFTENELKEAENCGWKRFSFGFPQMRAETAAVVIPAIMLYEWGGARNP